jgi:glycine/D-amino acid oxidase-like deaminating enzyme
VSALLIPEHGYVRVADLIAGLVSSFTGRISFRRGRVLALEPQATGVRVRTDSAVTTADMLVLAAGAWSGPLARPALPVRPVRGQVVELQCGVRPFSRILWDESCYMVPWCNGSVLVGATSEDAGFDETIVDDATRRLTGAAHQLAPALAGARVSAVRVGLRPATPDELPVIGRSSTMPHVIYATGHYRHGILLAPLTARLVADLVTGEPPHPLLGLVQPSRRTL